MYRVAVAMDSSRNRAGSRPGEPALAQGASALARPHLLRGELHRLDNVLVAGAAAEIAGERAADLGVAGAGVVTKQLDRRQDHPRRAITALQPVLFPEAFLNRMEPAAGGRFPGQALDGGDVGAAAWTASTVHDFTALPSSS